MAFPIQGTAVDGMKQAMMLLYPHLKRLGAKILLAMHDELLVEAPEEHADAVKELMREHMIAGMRKYVPSVPIVVEPKVMARWTKQEDTTNTGNETQVELAAPSGARRGGPYGVIASHIGMARRRP